MDQPSSGPFPPTSCTLLDLMARPEAPEYRSAWEAFLRGYWPPLFAYLRRTGSSRDEALDLLQDFFVAGLERRILSRFDPTRGKLRTFLLVCLANVRRQARRHDRVRPDRRALSISSTQEGEAFLAKKSSESPEAIFEENWIQHVGARCRAALETRLASDGDEASLRILREWVFASPRPSGAWLAAELGIRARDLYLRASRLRRVFAVEVEREIRSWSRDARGESAEVISTFLGHDP